MGRLFFCSDYRTFSFEQVSIIDMIDMNVQLLQLTLFTTTTTKSKTAGGKQEPEAVVFLDDT